MIQSKVVSNERFFNACQEVANTQYLKLCEKPNKHFSEKGNADYNRKCLSRQTFLRKVARIVFFKTRVNILHVILNKNEISIFYADN